MLSGKLVFFGKLCQAKRPQLSDYLVSSSQIGKKTLFMANKLKNENVLIESQS